MASAAQHASITRLLLYADVPGVASRRGPGWVAVRTGIDSNDLNGVCSEPGASISLADVTELIEWLAGVPACWQTPQPDAELSELLVAAGARPDTGGNWSGLSALSFEAAAAPAGVTIAPLASPADLDAWLDVAGACEWIETEADRAVRRAVFLGLGLDHPRLRRWAARAGERPVGFATACLDGDVVDLVDLGVLAEHRRTGIGGALVAARLAWATEHGATRAVSAPTSDGWRLQQSLGFTLAPAEADTCFHLPTTSHPSGGLHTPS